jgi:hypothetical protein
LQQLAAEIQKMEVKKEMNSMRQLKPKPNFLRNAKKSLSLTICKHLLMLLMNCQNFLKKKEMERNGGPRELDFQSIQIRLTQQKNLR